MSDWNRGVIEEFRANKGKVAAFGHQPLLLVTHTGAKTKTQRTNPLACFRDGENYFVVASKGGAPTNPDWYYNLVANPRVTIEVGTEKGIQKLDVTAKPADPNERKRLWAMVKDRNPSFRDYEKKTSRTIPLVILTPSSGGAKSGPKMP